MPSLILETRRDGDTRRCDTRTRLGGKGRDGSRCWWEVPSNRDMTAANEWLGRVISTLSGQRRWFGSRCQVRAVRSQRDARHLDSKEHENALRCNDITSAKRESNRLSRSRLGVTNDVTELYGSTELAGLVSDGNSSVERDDHRAGREGAWKRIAKLRLRHPSPSRASL